MLIYLNRIETYSAKVALLLFTLVMPTVEAAQHARKIGAALGTAAYWGLTLAQPATLIKDLHEKKTLEETYEHYELAKSLVPRAISFAEQELTELGLPKARVIPHLINSVALYNDICIYAPLLDRVEESMQKIALAQEKQEEPAASDLASLMIFKGVIHHEVQHIKNGDIDWRFLAASIAAAAVPVGVRAAWHVVRPVASHAKKLPNIRKVVSGLVNFIASGQILNCAMRKIEQQADDGIQDPVAIKGACIFLQEYNETIRAQEKDSPLVVWFIDHNLTDHPSPATRLIRFNDRLQEAND